MNSPFLLLQTNNCIARDLWIYREDIINTPCPTLLPQNSAGLLPSPVAGNLNPWWALLRSTIHLNISNNLTNIPLQHAWAKHTNHSTSREEWTWVNCPRSLNSDADLPTALLGMLHHALTITLNTELLMITFLAFHPISSFMIVFNAYLMKSSHTLQYPAAPVAYRIRSQFNQYTYTQPTPGTGELCFQMLLE